MSKLYQYRPLPDYLELKNSEIDGMGLFAKKDIKFIDFEYNPIVNTHLVFHGNVERLPAGGWLNHADNPNCVMYRTRIPYSQEDCKDYYYTGIYPERDIQEGEELTIDYNKCFGILGMDCVFNLK